MSYVERVLKLAESLSEEQIQYLHVAQKVFESGVIFKEMLQIEIEEAGGEITSGENFFVLDVNLEGLKDDQHVAKVVKKWKELCRQEGDNSYEEFYDMFPSGEKYRGDSGDLNLAEDVLFPYATINDFKGVVMRATGDIGVDIPIRSHQGVEVTDLIYAYHNGIRCFIETLDEEDILRYCL